MAPGLPQSLYDRFQQLAIDTIGERIFFTTGYGATETASGCMAIYFPTEEVGIGLPMPGITLKLVPNGPRYEVRLRGPMITPGYLSNPEANRGIFDDEGFYRTGDTAQLHDPADIQKGLKFAGRLAEDFKLATGTWVAAGRLRAEFLEAFAPLLADVLVCGENREYVALLAWPKTVEAAADTAELSRAARSIQRRTRLERADRAAAAVARSRRARTSTRSRTRARSISESRSARRAADVERLYAIDAGPDVILPARRPTALTHDSLQHQRGNDDGHQRLRRGGHRRQSRDRRGVRARAAAIGRAEGLCRQSRPAVRGASRATNFPGVATRIELDVTDGAEVEAAARNCGDVNIVVNNAGLFANQLLIGAPDMAAARQEMEVNYFGTLAMCRAFAPVLARNGGGAIINVLSAAALISDPEHGRLRPVEGGHPQPVGCGAGRAWAAGHAGHGADRRLGRHAHGRARRGRQGKARGHRTCRACAPITRGIDELDTDRMAVEVRAALHLDPKGLEKRMAKMLHAPVIRTGR